MGIPSLIITDEMAPKIQEILESASIKVEKETFPNEKEIVGHAEIYGDQVANLYVPSYCLHCESDEGYRVKLNFGRVLTEPYSLGLAIWPDPRSSFLKSIVKPDKNKLVDEIVVVLKKHGAKEFDEVLENKEHNIG